MDIKEIISLELNEIKSRMHAEIMEEMDNFISSLLDNLLECFIIGTGQLKESGELDKIIEERVEATIKEELSKLQKDKSEIVEAEII